MAVLENVSEGPVIRTVGTADTAEWLRLRTALWPGSSAEHALDIERWLAAPPAQEAVFVLDCGGHLEGFLEARLRDYADGCDSSPVGYIEGWYISPAWRQQGWGRVLVKAAEDWARALGCREMASDTEFHNLLSQQAHLALGYEEAERLVCFRKDL